MHEKYSIWGKKIILREMYIIRVIKILGTKMLKGMNSSTLYGETKHHYQRRVF